MGEAVQIPKEAMDVDAFLAWREGQSADYKYELVNGHVVAMGRGSFGHSLTVAAVAAALEAAARSRGLPCRALVEGPAIRTSGDNIRVPDVLVHCGPFETTDTVSDNPVIVVEIVSPESAYRDTILKPADYALNERIAHYLIVNADERRVMHVRRLETGQMLMTPDASGELELDPPGLRVRVRDFFDEGAQ